MLIAMGLETDVQELGHEVCGVVRTAEEAVELARTARPDLILMDVRLAGCADGVDAANQIHQEGTCRHVIFVTGSVEAQKRVREDHPSDLLFKPVTQDDLSTAFGRI